MGTIARSWDIFKKSLALISAEKKLLVFPLISFFAMFMLFVLICGGSIAFIIFSFIIFSPDSVASFAGNDPETTSSVFELILFAACYFLAMFVSNFCSTAFFSEIFIGLHGGNVSIRRGLNTAMSRIKALLLWTLLASTVGILLKMFENKSGFIGKIVLRIIGAAWAVVSCFSIPAIALDSELSNPFDVLKKSAVSIKKTWGESLVGFAGISILNLIVVACLFPIIFVALVLIVFCDESWAFAAAGGLLIAGTVVVLTICFYLVSVAQTVYRAALYLYADGERPVIFTDEEMLGAFTKK